MVKETGRGEAGNITWRRSTTVPSAPTLPAWYPRFADYLEEGIRDLCLFFVQDLSLITYTSCQGHFHPGADNRLSHRHVGLLPRSEKEYEKIHDFFLRSIRRLQLEVPMVGVAVGIIRHKLSDPTISRAVLDLEFYRPLDATVEQYLYDLENATKQYLRTARETAWEVQMT
tara:strand:+ start:387 stop:899 length:513 start_codon:yes stop_codon:yes gene_type:complete